MDRIKATKLCRETLDKYGLKGWGVRVSTDNNLPYLGLCSHRDMCIFLNAFHIDTHPEPEIQDTILHEVAHAIVGPSNGHNAKWTTKAMEMGVNNLSGCSTISLNPEIIEAIRSGHTVEVEFEETTVERRVTVEEKVYQPKYKVTRLQDYCPECLKDGKRVVAKEKFSFEGVDKQGNPIKMITLECFHTIKKFLPKATPYDTLVSNSWKDEVKNCKHSWTKNQCDKCGEFRLFQFQVVGARKAEAGLASQKGFGIFDDMGLGKTVQAIAVDMLGLQFTVDTGKEHRPYRRTMVVTKSAIKFQWFKAYITWGGPSYLAQIISTSKDFLFPNMRVYIIPYDLLRRFPKEKLHALNVDLIILDECQQIKNVDSARTQEVRKLISANPACKVLPLSGTPWKNRGSEFFPVLNMMDPTKFSSQQGYLDTWVEYYWEGNKRKQGGIRNVKRFKEYTESLIIRREYEEVMEEYPEVNRTKLPVLLNELEQTTYDEAVSDFVAWYNEYVMEGREEAISGIELLGKMARMRHVTGLAKIPATLGFIEEFVEETERKIVVFVHHKDVGQLMHSALINTDEKTNPDWHHLAKTLKEEGVVVLQYTSQHTGKPEGTIIQDKFNNSPRAVMIASTLACGEGLNLQTCADSILHERQWNPQNEDQATPGRFRRIGQVSNVINITMPEADGTIDQHLDYIVEGKRGRYHIVMNKGEVPKWNESEFARELAQTIVQKFNEKKGKNGSVAAKILAVQNQ